MVKYTCDVCGKEAVSVQHVDRYQLSADFCHEHLVAWIDFMLKKLPAHRQHQNTHQVDHYLSRAMMDVISYSPLPHDPPPMTAEEKAQMPEGCVAVKMRAANGIEELHQYFKTFVEVHKPINKK